MLGIPQKLTRHTRKEVQVTKEQEKKESIEKHPQEIQPSELSDMEFKMTVINKFGKHVTSWKTSPEKWNL